MTETLHAGCPVVDFDPHTQAFVEQFRSQVTELHDKQIPIAWTPHYGGAWLVSGMDEVLQISRDDDTFSSANGVTDDGIVLGGVTMPTMPIPPQVPIELDPPEFQDYRRMIAKPLGPNAMEGLRPQIAEFTRWCIDRHIESGSMDLIHDVAGPVPALTTLNWLGLPLDGWEAIAQNQHELMYVPASDPRFAGVIEGITNLEAIVERELVSRRRAPRPDLLSQLANETLKGELAPLDKMVSLVMVMIAGGVDTTTALIGNALIYLDEHPEGRKRLVDDPKYLMTATNEFLRYYTPIQRHARTATRDVEISGTQMRAGDRVILYWTAANFDPRVFEDPDDIRLDRYPNRHATFGLGIHRCAGSHLARIEFEVVVTEILRRVPDYKITRESLVRYPTIGIVNGYVSAPAAFSPGKPSQPWSAEPPILAS